MTTFRMEIPQSRNNDDEARKYLDRRRDFDAHAKLDQLLHRRFDGLPCEGGKSKFKEKLQLFDEKIRRQEQNLRRNPFSQDYRHATYSKIDDVGIYGRPEAGSLTEKRGIKAGNHIGREILELCQVIEDCGYERPDGVKIITFGHLFQLYTKISDKVVGMLLRARRHGLVEFEGEMLYQRRDEEKIIALKKNFTDIEKLCQKSNDPAKCIKFSG